MNGYDCACPRMEARDCHTHRYDPLGDGFENDPGEQCECVCHDRYEFSEEGESK